MEPGRRITAVPQRPLDVGRQVGVPPWRQFVGLARDGQGRFPLHHKQHRLSARFGLRPVRPAARLDLHNVLRKRFGKARKGARQDPEARTFPERQKGRHDVPHHALRDHRIGLGEDGAVGHDLVLTRVAASGGVIGGHRDVSFS